MSKNKSYAEAGLESIQAVSGKAQMALVGGGDSNWIEATSSSNEGGLEPISYYFRTSAPKKPGKSKYQVLSKGDIVVGTYEGSFTSENNRFKTPTHKIRLTDGTLTAIGGTTLLNKGFAQATIGKGVKITYNGSKASKNGNDVQLFSVFVEASN